MWSKRAWVIVSALVGCSPSAPPGSPAPGTSAGSPAHSDLVQRTTARPAGSDVAAMTVDAPATPPSCPGLDVPLPDIPFGVEDPPAPRIVDPQVLAPFFDKAAVLLRGRAKDHIRIAVYGDSNLTMDFQTGAMRRRLQGQYGDAGHGFVALGRPWSHYKHMDVRHDIARGFETYVVTTKPLMDSGYGLSGIAVESAFGNATTWVATANKDAPIGTQASRLEIYHLKDAHYGTFEILVDDVKVATVNSESDERGVGVARVDMPDAPHLIHVVSNHPRKRVRLLGAVLERGKPSFVVDSFGVGALNSRAMAREDPLINKAMLQQRRYDLVVFMTGANDGFTLDETPGHMKTLIERQREALPGVPILVVTPADRGKDHSFRPTIDVVEQRKEIAKNNGAALWDLWEAMGGRGSMKRFKQRGLARFDYIHFNQPGGMWAGDRLTYALMRELALYAKERPELGCPAK